MHQTTDFWNIQNLHSVRSRALLLTYDLRLPPWCATTVTVIAALPLCPSTIVPVPWRTLTWSSRMGHPLEKRFGKGKATKNKLMRGGTTQDMIDYIWLYHISKSNYSSFMDVMSSTLDNQIMVNCWFLGWLFGFLGSPCQRDCDLRAPLESQTTRPNQQWTIGCKPPQQKNNRMYTPLCPQKICMSLEEGP